MGFSKDQLPFAGPLLAHRAAQKKKEWETHPAIARRTKLAAAVLFEQRSHIDALVVLSQPKSSAPP
jgi:hypothetical protein